MCAYQIINHDAGWLNSIKDLKKSYRKTQRTLIRARIVSKDPIEQETLSEMLSDCNYAIEWMHTGRRPSNRRGVERRSAYQREKLMDPVRLQSYARNTVSGGPANLSDSQRFQIEDALSRLSARERECYVLAYGECFSFSEIAEMLKITKSSVEEYVNRDQTKISKNLENSLFLMME